MGRAVADMQNLEGNWDDALLPNTILRGIRPAASDTATTGAAPAADAAAV
jgi:hypothetical protein